MTESMQKHRTGETLISVDDLAVHFPLRGGWFAEKHVLKAVDGVTLEIKQGSFFGLVGESGSGSRSFFCLPGLAPRESTSPNWF